MIEAEIGGTRKQVLVSGAVTVSGQPVTVSGDHVFVESGVVVASGLNVVPQSGLGVVPQSGVGVTVASGLGVLISGQYVEVQSGVGVVVQSGVYTVGGFASGAYFASGIGVQIQSGASVLISGQHVFVESGVYTASGIYQASGVGVQVQSGVYLASGIWIAGGGGASGALVAVASGEIHILSGLVALQSGEVHILSGLVAVQSGEVHILSGAVTTSISGQPINVASGFLNSAGVVPATFSGLYTASGIYAASGVGVQIQSGQGVLVQSGVYVASGIYQASGVGVQIQSGAGVLISGQHVYVESGVYIASGVGVVAGLPFTALLSGEIHILSGEVTIQSGVDVTVGFYEDAPADRASGAVTQLLTDIKARLAVRVDTHTVMTPVDIQSKVSGVCLISGEHVFVESGIYMASGVGITWVQTSGEVHVMSGLIAVQSGEVHVMSGAVTIYLLSSEPIINNSGNPIVVGAISHGIPLWSNAIISVTVKALYVNSGDLYLGGFKSGQGPYSGQGFVLSPGEAINLDVDNTGKVHLFAQVSGDRATYVGITG